MKKNDWFIDWLIDRSIDRSINRSLNESWPNTNTILRKVRSTSNNWAWHCSIRQLWSQSQIHTWSSNFLWYFRWDLALSDYLKLYLLILIIYFIYQYWLLANLLSTKYCPQVPIYSMSNISTGSMPTAQLPCYHSTHKNQWWIQVTSHQSNSILGFEVGHDGSLVQFKWSLQFRSFQTICSYSIIIIHIITQVFI